MARKTRPFWQIEQTAKNLLENCNCYNAPASNIDFMILSCKLDIIPLDLHDDKFLGLFGKDDSGHHFVAFNNNISKERILFTKAHELGHYVLGHKLSADIVQEICSEEKNPQETEANVFASALLMPKDLFIKDFTIAINKLSQLQDIFGEFKKLTDYNQDKVVEELKYRFHTSKEATKYRIKNLIEVEYERFK